VAAFLVCCALLELLSAYDVPWTHPRRLSSFRSDLGRKRAHGVESARSDDELGLAEAERRSVAFRSDLGKRLEPFRSDLEKKRASQAFRSDLGKRPSSDGDHDDKRSVAFRSDLGKRVAAAFRSDLGRRSLQAAAKKAYSAFRSDLGKRLTAFRSDLGKRA